MTIAKVPREKVQYICLKYKQENNLDKKVLIEEITLDRSRNELHFQLVENLALLHDKYIKYLTIQYSFEPSLILSFTAFFFLVHN